MEELSVIRTTYEVHKKLVELTATIDKKYRHTLGEPAVAHCAQTLHQLILAKHAPRAIKAPSIIQAEAELTALLLRTMLELHLANDTNLLKLQAKLTEARRQIGGWRKSVS